MKKKEDAVTREEFESLKKAIRDQESRFKDELYKLEEEIEKLFEIIP